MNFNIKCSILILTITIIILIPLQCTGSEIVLKQMSLRDGIESQISLNWPLEDDTRIYSNKHFIDVQQVAKKSGVDLLKHLDDVAVSGYNSSTKKFFMLFYNLAEQQECDKEYLIQRVKIRKVSYNKKGKKISDTKTYLVEAMKTSRKAIKRADRHIKSYSLKKAYRRSIFVDIEIGCGTMTNIASTKSWPFAKNKLYKLLQDYSSKVGIYNQIDFDFSKNYNFNFNFDRNGYSSVEWPDFINN